MKKLLIVCVFVSMCVLSSCNKKKEETNNTQIIEEEKTMVSLITDYSNIEENSFNDSTWQGILEFTEQNGYANNFYRALFDTDDERKKAIEQAVEEGTDIVVCPGTEFSSVIYDVQNKYDNQILLIDTEPQDKDGKVEINDNVHCILYREEEAGFLAGYAAVMEGYRRLGFLGGMEFDAVKRYEYGYIQGAELAAKELKLGKKDVEIKSMYAGGFEATSDITKKMTKWYEDGTEVIFSCGGGIIYSVIEAAEKDEKRKIIGVDCDQSSESEQIIFSAMKGLSKSVKEALNELYKNNGVWPEFMAGKTATLGAAEDSVGLSATDRSWRMNKYSIKEYNVVYGKLKNGKIKIYNDKLPDLKYVQYKEIKEKTKSEK